MHLREATIRDFRRFTDLTIRVSGTPKLVVLSGPNGVGKSALFDAFRAWAGWRGGGGMFGDDEYFVKGGGRGLEVGQVGLVFHESVDLQSGTAAARKSFYLRTAYRNDPEFTLHRIERVGSLLDTPLQTARRMIESDVRVTENYQRMVALTLDDLYGGEQDDARVGDLRESYVGVLRDALLRLFPDLELIGPGDPLGGGTFQFRKGVTASFPYKNLSAGEKAVFDLLLDMVVKRATYDDTIFCIDEPEAHLSTRVQASVLAELVALVNDRSQLWIATHSIGMLREAQRLKAQNANAVEFLDFAGHEFDTQVIIEPKPVDRAFWKDTLAIAVGDLAALVAPSRLVLCEGKPVEGNVARSEFDARCLRAILGKRTRILSSFR